ncbi:GL17584 [Drosophila persimilis]|uniref:GL17584 n=1 Tax=Drosophila persimilis TaxID=7234 RepID=B4GHS0_DROPE|nr:GL17584 [Drosophila persimilis]
MPVSTTDDLTVYGMKFQFLLMDGANDYFTLCRIVKDFYQADELKATSCSADSRRSGDEMRWHIEMWNTWNSEDQRMSQAAATSHPSWTIARTYTMPRSVLTRASRSWSSRAGTDLHRRPASNAFNVVNKKIRKHEQVPPVSSRRACIKSCGKGEWPSQNPFKDISPIISTSTPSPSRLVYAAGVKLMNLGESY